ncbi:Hypothetical protein HVR_LOCUS978 [uncultured virus]|nr:Hypothetical protein HVR_LOCUS978 [uncultured virus]
MYAIIDVKFSPTIKSFPYPQTHDIEGVDVILTEFNGDYEFRSVSLTTINEIKQSLENNIVISFCYDFEVSFLNKYGIHPRQHIDLNHLLGFGNLASCCSLLQVFFNKENICKTLYELSLKNVDKIHRVTSITAGKRLSMSKHQKKITNFDD